jgi:hypothetical protein
MSRLPEEESYREDVLENFRQVLMDGDYQEIDDHINRIGEQDPDLGQELRDEWARVIAQVWDEYQTIEQARDPRI